MIREKEEQFDTVIGLEVHVELSTKSKIFCGCPNEFQGSPNTHVCPVCMGMPGALPVLNKKAVEYAVAIGLVLKCEIDRCSRFDRKNYFYPDNPQNYQITQFYHPIGTEGYLSIMDEQKQEKNIGIAEIHLEEDAGKLIHDSETESSFVDFNRAGVPLIEIVTKPHFQNAFEVIQFLEKLRVMIQYTGASDCKMQEGSMRADVNLSVKSKGSLVNGTRTEMKNLNSFRAISRAIEEERKRQIGLLEQGREVTLETRRWDDRLGRSFTMRGKEESRDYRYFPEPDLMPLMLSKQWIHRIKKGLPEMPEEKMRRYKAEYQLPDYDIQIITGDQALCILFEETVKICGNPKSVSNWIMGKTLEMLKAYNMDAKDIRYSPENLASLIILAEKKVINSTIAKEVFEKMFQDNTEPQEYIKRNGLDEVCEEDTLKLVLNEVMEENKKSVQDYQNGREQALSYLVGKTIKAMGGKADPLVVKGLLIQRLQ